MLYRKSDASLPSLLVEDGKTVNVGTIEGLTKIAIRPRTVAALQAICGVPLKKPPRLGDESAFERVASASGFVNVGQPDPNGRVGGYSPTFVRSVLQSLEPSTDIPATVKLRLRYPPDALHDPIGQPASPGTPTSLDIAAARLDPTLRLGAEVPVPKFLRELAVVGMMSAFEDIVVGFNSTLVFDADVLSILARNVLGYNGSRLVQKSPYIIADVLGTLRGSIPQMIHVVTAGVLTINWTVLDKLAVEYL